MKVKTDTYDVGVIVGRFQVPSLHDGHLELFQAVKDRHDKVLVFLGMSPLRGTQNNPLDFQARKQMIVEQFPEIDVLFIKDVNNDEAWSKILDDQIETLVTPSQSVVLYGARDSFIEHYHGRHATQELEAEHPTSGTAIRREVGARSVVASVDFRAGAVWQSFNRFPTSYTTVDVAVFNEDETKILLARKPYADRWQLIGGFVDPANSTLESAARREVSEEAHIGITDPEYVGSFRIDDWRYRGEVDQILTVLFRAKRLNGQIQADDDIEEVRWADVDTLSIAGEITENHRPLLEAVLTNHPSER